MSLLFRTPTQKTVFLGKGKQKDPRGKKNGSKHTDTNTRPKTMGGKPGQQKPKPKDTKVTGREAV